MELIFNVSLFMLVVSFVSCVVEFRKCQLTGNLLGFFYDNLNRLSAATVDRCKNTDKECLLNSWNKYIKQSGINGIPELDVPNLHELLVDKAIINVGGEALNPKLALLNNTLSGLDTITFTKITGFTKDPKSMSKFELSGYDPNFKAKGPYKASGKVLFIPLSGNGYGEIEVFNVTFKIIVETTTEVKDGEEHLVIGNVRCNYDSTRNHYRFDNLLNNKELSDNINDVFNNNQDVINKELAGPIGVAISKVFKGIFIPVFRRYPYRSFFL